ncbi:Rpn5 like 26S proteasomal regulatory subunit 12 [Cryptosporidium sp. chipmunk genotype I]|uniref:Rpn5 like 26S proteasomal regulatory subunit 12 n=1 Tax=Cryptosporidium sp. chipmunk genotype I TaxID=1280935 RepID=UPI00351A8429|nr:Rpn5 like 26S proteasomal regulatory subunit 12 [Cryptosporidium sp. chipmunk genotype I]
MQDQNTKEQFNETVNPISELESLVKDPKCTQDLSAEADSLIAKLEKDGVNEMSFQSAVEEILVLEKKCRQVSDSNSSCKIIYKIISWLLKYSRNIDESLLYVQKICKKRSQLKKVISYIIQLFLNLVINSIVSLNPNFAKYNSSRKTIETMTNLEESYRSLSYEIKDMDECLKIINTLNEITQGKIYLELERARLMLILSNIKQEGNDLKEAFKLLEDVTVETIGNMDLREKTQYVLEQMRLSLLCKDFVRLQIFAKKINPKIIEKFIDLKVIYYQYLIILWHYEQNPKEISICFLNLLNSVTNFENNGTENNYEKLISEIPEYMKSPISQYNLSEKVPTIASCIEGYVIYLILGPYSTSIRAELIKFNTDYQKYIERNVQYISALLSDYINNELIFLESTKTFNYTIPKYFNQLSNCFFFSSNDYEMNSDVYYTEYKRCKINLCNRKDRFTLFMQRIQERNISIISCYYKTISFQRVQDLLNLDGQELQLVVNHLVERGIFSAKINQPAGIITFTNNNTNGQFNKFHDNIGEILNKLDLLKDLISNDMMIHQFNCKVNNK